MRTPFLVILIILAIIGGLVLGALLGVVVIGLIIGLVGAAIIGLAGFGAVKAVQGGADPQRRLPR